VLAPPHDPEALAAAVDALWADPAERRRLALNARRYVEKRFPVDAMVRGYEELYKELAG
jgi:rhamnosyl/mannosyltransferase